MGAGLPPKPVKDSPDNAEIRPQKRGESFRFGRIASSYAALSRATENNHYAELGIMAIFTANDTTHRRLHPGGIFVLSRHLPRTAALSCNSTISRAIIK